MIIKKIIHIADLHLRNFKRHKEYREVFKRLFKYINSIADPNTVIYLGGDIVHSKTDMTPELIAIATYFLKSCADLCTTILIAGNHDTNLANQSRLDALTPLVESMNHPNLHYWKDTGVYVLGGITFSVYSVFGPTTDWIRPQDIDTPNMKIILHHGAVFGALTDLNHNINNETVTTEIFNGADLVLMGDIHKRQFLNAEKTIHYVGSLIQQSHAEIFEKGITVWDVETKTSEFVRIPNDYGYATLHMSYGKVQDDKEYILSFPKKLRLRIKYEHTTKEQIQAVVASVKKKHIIEELSLSKIKELDKFKNSTTAIENVRDIEYQNKLITEYLEHTNVLNVDPDGLRHINRVINSELNSGLKLIRNVKWKPLKLEFSNMFSYGPGNTLNFTSLNGIHGIFSKNASGKSSLLDILTYCVYDKCSRAWKAKDVLNNQKTKFKSKFDLELNDEIYSIERNGFKDSRKGNVKVEVDFYKTDSTGNKIYLNGEDRDGTNKAIRDHLGTYDDFLLTALSTQNDNKNFIFKTQKERKELLYSFLDLSVFDELQTIAKKYGKEKNDELSILETEYYGSDYVGLDEQRKVITNNYNTKNSELVDCNQKIQSNQERLDVLNTKLIPLNVSVKWDDAQASKLDSIKLNISTESTNLDSAILTEDTLQQTKNQLIESLNGYPLTEIQNQLSIISELTSDLQSKRFQIKTIQGSIDSCQELISKLDHHIYDPNCDYCVQNEFVKDAKLAIEKLPNLKMEFDAKTDDYNKIEEQIQDLQIWKERHEAAKLINNDILKNAEELLKAKDSKQKINDKLSKLQNEKIQLESTFKLYNENQQNILTNEKINLQRAEIIETLATLKSKSASMQTEVNKLINSLDLVESKIERKQALNDKIIILRKTANEFNSYVDMMSNDGIPYIILQKILPVIENEVNITLQEIVDFTVKFETDDKNNINCYLLYSNDNSWPVEMASGMERFILSLSIRIALVDITSLPRPNFMAIDEGFGALDSDKITGMVSLFDYMRTKFDFIIAVSHVDTMRDMVDGLIDVYKNPNGFSEVSVK